MTFRQHCEDRGLRAGLELVCRWDGEVFTIERVSTDPDGLWVRSRWVGPYFIQASELGEYGYAYLGDALARCR